MLQQANLAQAAKTLAPILEDLRGEVDKAKTLPLNSLLSGWFLSREEYEALDNIRKDIGKIFEFMARGVIPEVMRANDSKTVTLDSIGYRFTISQRFSCSIIPDEEGGNRLAAYEFLRPHGIVTETVNSSTLGSFAKKMIQDEGKEMPDNLFKTSLSDNTSATKVK